MTKLFISYSRVDLEFAKRLVERIQTAFPDLTIWRDDAPHGLIGGDNWWGEILKAIAESDVFIYVLSNESVQSVYCQAEFTEARRLQKRIITIQARDKTELTDELDDIQFVDMKHGPDDPDALPRLFAAITKQLRLAKARRPLWKPATPKPRKEAPPTRAADAPEVDTPPLERPPAEQEALRLARSGVRWQITGVILSVILGVAALAVPLLDRIGGAAPTAVAQASAAPSATPTPSPLITETLPPTPDPAVTSTLSNLEQLQTAQMQLTYAAATQAAADLTATQDTVLSANATATAQQIMATEAAAYATLRALSATPTPQPTSTPLPPTFTATPTPPPPTADPLQAALERARTFSGGNTDWQPFLWTFDDGVQMALVPAGCFMMGSTDAQIQYAIDQLGAQRDWMDDEQPVHEQCLEPFYIDRTEVTQADFERLGGVKARENWFDGADRPVERITWFEARDFCALRGARLPTEAEWEYAARGPDGLVYPWGNDFVADNVVYGANSSSQTANVGSRPGGASWVGAYDLSGNVWEWVSSVYADYPYDAADGREYINRTDGSRVLRGGSWYDYDTPARAANRIRLTPDLRSYGRGFRCARSS